MFALSPAGGPSAPGTWTETLLYEFTNTPAAGAKPLSGVVLADGVLYGTTYMGGRGYGAVYSLTAPAAGGAWTEKVLHIFGSGDGNFPEGGVLVKNGPGGVVLYGTTFGGGTDFQAPFIQLLRKAAPGSKRCFSAFRVITSVQPAA